MMKRTKKAALAGALALSLGARTLAAQEAIGSATEDYLELLALRGAAERPTLGYRSLSDSSWGVTRNSGPWQLPEALGAGRIRLRPYGPEFFGSYNSAYPHGVNDGALWQGVGLNVSLSAGIRAEALGFELTLKPSVFYEENRPYEILPAVAGLSQFAYFYWGIDTPQRMGNAKIAAFDWGDSEIRWSIGPLTAGFGTQAAWIGPGRRNAILLSNNAPSFPKLDIGLRKTTTPIGAVEFRSFWGRLHESDYFDADPTNDSNLITLTSFSWAPSFLPGLSLGFHRSMLSSWADRDLGSILTLLWPFMSTDAGTDRRDQRATLSADWLFPAAGAEVYVEWGRNDFSPNLDYILRYPFHSQAYTIGLRKIVIDDGASGALAELNVEISDLESSRDYDFLWPTTFYAHHIVRQGYTNRGQILGAGIGTGGNSQYLGLDLFHSGGRATVYVQRINRDNDYVYFKVFELTGSQKLAARAERYFNTELTVGADSSWLIGKNISLDLGAAYCLNLNPLYNPQGKWSSKIHNVNLTCGMAMQL
jgi:hypothetical protein